MSRTVFEEWIAKNVEVAMRDVRPFGEDRGTEAGKKWDEMELRLACLFAQARAFEDRAVIGEVQIGWAGELAPISEPFRGIFQRLFTKCLSDRSTKIEAVAMQFANGGWPLLPEEPGAGEDPRCGCGCAKSIHKPHCLLCTCQGFHRVN